MSEEQELVGEVLTHIDVDDANNVIMLVTASGKEFRVCHHQDCCERVRIVDTLGNWKELIGKQIIGMDIHAGNAETDPDGEPVESGTDTEITFRTDEHTVISRWFGESNGYYSESVDFDRIK